MSQERRQNFKSTRIIKIYYKMVFCSTSNNVGNIKRWEFLVYRGNACFVESFCVLVNTWMFKGIKPKNVSLCIINTNFRANLTNKRTIWVIHTFLIHTISFENKVVLIKKNITPCCESSHLKCREYLNCLYDCARVWKFKTLLCFLIDQIVIFMEYVRSELGSLKVCYTRQWNGVKMTFFILYGLLIIFIFVFFQILPIIHN